MEMFGCLFQKGGKRSRTSRSRRMIIRRSRRSRSRRMIIRRRRLRPYLRKGHKEYREEESQFDP